MLISHQLSDHKFPLGAVSTHCVNCFSVRPHPRRLGDHCIRQISSIQHKSSSHCDSLFGEFLLESQNQSCRAVPWRTGCFRSSHTRSGGCDSVRCSQNRSRNFRVGSRSNGNQPITSDADVEATYRTLDDLQGLEAGVIPESRLRGEPNASSAEASTSGRGAYASSAGALLYPPAQRRHIRRSW